MDKIKKLYLFNPITLEFENIKTKAYLKVSSFVVICFVILFTLGWITGTNKYIINHYINKTTIIYEKPFSEDNLVELLRDCNIKYPYIILAQAKLESNNFKSKLFKEQNNMFGMRKAKQRTTTALQEKNTYAYYITYEDCIYDMCLWQNTIIYNISNEEEYFAKLGERYAEDPNYINKLKVIIKQEKLKELFEE